MAAGLSEASQCQRAPHAYEPTPKSERNRVPPICANCSGSGLQNRIHPYRLSRSSCFAPSRSVFSGSAIRRAHLGPVVPRQGDAAQDASQPLTPLETLRSLSLHSRRFAAPHSTRDASQPLTPLETLRSLPSGGTDPIGAWILDALRLTLAWTALPAHACCPCSGRTGHNRPDSTCRTPLSSPAHTG